MQEIKAGDYVYIPSESLKPIKCFYDEDNECLRINFDDINAHVWFNENGCLIGKLDKTNIPLLWLATPENKAKIEQFYGIELEDVPDDVKEFENSLLELCDLVELHCKQTNHSLLGKIGIKQHNLILMFKNRHNIIISQSNNNGWISIFDVDNPPPKNEFVLVTNGFDVTTSRIETFFEDGEWLVAFENPDITHWQPLPQPPKE